VTGIRNSGHTNSDLSRAGDELALDLYDNSARATSIVVKALGQIYGLFGDDTYAVVFHGGVFNVPGYSNRLEMYLKRDVGEHLQVIYTKNMGNNACLEGAAIASMVKNS